MERRLQLVFGKEYTKSVVFDVIALSVVYLVPVISHFFAVPMYYIEPMRLMLLFAVIFTNKKNTLIIAATMPLFSFLVSGHPVLYKAFIMSAELVINAWLFFFLVELIKNKFAAMLFSIALAKLFYYIIKFGLLSFGIMQGDLVSTSLWIQLIVTLVYSSYFLLPEKKD